MKKPLLLLALALCAAPAAASEAGTAQRPLGAGVILGVPFGVTGKYWFDEKVAGQAAFGAFEGDVVFTGDVLLHADDVLPKSREGRLPLYVGAGVKVKSEDDTFFGFRAMVGISFFAARQPLELFAEVGPVMRVAPKIGGTVDGAAGVRFYF